MLWCRWYKNTCWICFYSDKETQRISFNKLCSVYSLNVSRLPFFPFISVSVLWLIGSVKSQQSWYFEYISWQREVLWTWAQILRSLRSRSHFHSWIYRSKNDIHRIFFTLCRMISHKESTVNQMQGFRWLKNTCYLSSLLFILQSLTVYFINWNIFYSPGTVSRIYSNNKGQLYL